MGKFICLLVLSLAATMHPQPVKAQGAGTICPMCRAMAHFRTCDRPLEGATIIRGRVTGAENAPCSQVLSLEPLRAAQAGLPARIRIDLGPCAFWAGQAGDLIDVAMAERELAADKIYSLACRHW